MMPIRRLPELLVNQIAAGEVIDRPASVVKELVENAIDAGATRVNVSIEGGGGRLIRVSDDGTGIAADELPLALEPHATSKIERPEQLETIATLGFRGEALASIGSVSRMRVTSRHCGEAGLADTAWTIEMSGDRLEGPRPAGGGPGTVIEVRDLFFNTPARRKFLRAESTEAGHVNETFARIAMVWPELTLTLTHNGRTVRELPAANSFEARAAALLGQTLAPALLAFEREETLDTGRVRVHGLAGRPEIARASGRHLYLCVNGRAVKDRGLAHAVREAYRGLIAPDRQPVAAANVELDARSVDVNVHPAKTEVRFRDPRRIHRLLLAAVRQCLFEADLTPSAEPASARPPAAAQAHAPGRAFAESPRPAPPAPGTGRGSRPGTGTDPDGFLTGFQAGGTHPKGFVYGEVREAMPAWIAESGTESRHAEAPGAPAVQTRSILQVHDGYLVTSDAEGLLIIDQHALHERVMFEELAARVGRGNLERQRLLVPASLPAEGARQALAETMAPLFERLGIEIIPAGPRALAVHAFPSFLFERGVDPVAFLEDLFDRAESGALDPAEATAEEHALHEVLDMMACKAAVKMGDRMSEAELAALLEKRRQVERSSACPHGRPTSVRLTRNQLEKMFHRG